MSGDSTTTPGGATAPDGTGGALKEQPAAPAPKHEGEGTKVIREIMSGNAMISVLAVLVALVIGGILIAFTDPRVLTAMGYFFNDPGATFSAIWAAVSEAYGALWRGATYDPGSRTWQGRLGIFETLTFATPLILSGLAVTLAFRVGLFNIGAKGQIILGATFAGVVGFMIQLPPGIHLIAVILAGAVGGALWGGIAGFLKAKTGAHEVIVTIMLNYIAVSLVLYLLKNQLKDPSSSNPISPRMHESAMFPLLLGPNYRVHAGLILAVLAVFVVSWLLNRSTLGFEYRAIGANPRAARTAGMNVSRGYITVMLISGALAGLAGVTQLAGTEKMLDADIAGSIGFDAITVALLGRSTPWGTFFAALLFGAFKAGGTSMAINADVSIDIVAVVQSLIVLFIAAPPLVRSMFRIKEVRREGVKA
ncbi:simple sugar transport system permease protein [Arthrobacter stackebrandtii]|uniref:Simple sugar transport system permease protein n=1 Tax=Arthrobacter stackebrandtii TaxID=272161 RepID=A0ABS4YS91_9MICC|nr:simple sugar transport system permease protein [Arthrobacter stackebrandtii]PYG99687.1 ABC transporter permease [Arthrobacter stackebrandtii]